MGDGFKVDTKQLETFVADLERSVKDLEEARTALSHVRSGEIGTARLDEACDTFQKQWKYGAEQMSEMIGSISEGVKANQLSYEEFERELAQALNKMTEEGTSAGQGGGK